MPAPWTIREKRIRELVEWANHNNINTYEEILEHAKTLYPTLMEQTLRSYAEAALRILEKEK